MTLRPRAVRLLLGAILLAAPGCAQQSQPAPYDPYHAEKDLEAGTFYLKKGRYDAAIDRFEEALRYQPHLGKAYRLLGEAHEKKGDRAEAVKAYEKYLEILPGAKDARKIRKRTEKLKQELEKEARPERPSG